MRRIWIDIARGLGIFLVIFGHLTRYGAPLSNWIFSFHMPLFFFLSGCVYKYKEEESAKNQYRKIFYDLIVPYLLICIVGLIISLLIPNFRPVSIGKVLIESLYFVQPEMLHVGQIWFLFCLAVVQFFFILIKRKKIKKRNETIIIFISFILAFFIGYVYRHYLTGVAIFGHRLIRLPFKIDSALMGLFFLGYESMRTEIFKNIFATKVIIKIVVIITSLVMNVVFGVYLNGSTNLAENYYHNPFFFLLSSFSGIFMIIMISSLIKQLALIEFYGINSLSIFAFHSMFLYLFAFVLSTVYHVDFIIMDNIPLVFCFVGLIFVSILSVPMPFIYKATIKQMINKIKGFYP